MNAEEARKITGDEKGSEAYIYARIDERAKAGYSSVDIKIADCLSYKNLTKLLRYGYKLSYYADYLGEEYLRIEWK